METRRFKTRNGSDLAFSVVGQGMGPIGDFYELLDEKMTISTVEQAYQAGIRLFDTSPHYGNGLSESRLGAGLRRIPRDEIVVSTKIGRVMDPFHKPAPRNPDAYSPGFAGGFPHAPHFDYSYDGTMRSVEHSLLRTGLSRFDILLIHDCDVWTHGKEADQRFKEAAEARPELLAHHYTEAGDWEQGTAAWQRAGEQALSRGALKEAHNHLRSAIAVLLTSPATAERAQRELLRF